MLLSDKPTIDIPAVENHADVSAIGRYYDASQFWYRAFYSDRSSLAVHYGIWPRPDMARADALLEPYRIVLRHLEPSPGEHVLDAGCGVGGASRWLALNTAARFTGITASRAQAARARRYVAAHGLSGRVQFHCMDYHRTAFADHCFDHVFGIESFCYAYPRPAVLFRELRRILKPRGRLLMLDGILRRRPATAAEQRLANGFCAGFGMRGWNTADDILEALAESGFRNISWADQSPFIEPSVMDIDRRHRVFRNLRLLRRLRIVPDAILQSLEGTEVQKSLYEAGLLGYALFCAERE